MTSEWDGTPWEGRAVAVAKAATGPGVGFFSTAYPLSSMERTPQALNRTPQKPRESSCELGRAEL